MGRWSQYDEDDYRLPEGMQRVGYDADTQTYTYEDANGCNWEGAAGDRYGTLRRVRNDFGPTSTTERRSLSAVKEGRVHDEADYTDDTDDGHDDNNKKAAWRIFAPFFFLVCLVLLLLFRLLMIGPAPDARPAKSIACKEHESGYTILPRDTY